MAALVRMPSPLAGATEAAIQSWLTAVGQQIAVGDPLAEIETDKAVVEYASEVEGTVALLIAEPGANLDVGTPIAVVLAPGEDESAVQAALAEAGIGEPAVTEVPAAPEPETAAASADSAPSPTPQREATGSEPPSSGAPHGGRRFVSPIVRRLAREQGIDLDAVAGSGPDGRVTRRDFESALLTARQEPEVPSAATATPVAAAPTGDDSSGSGFTDVPLTGMRRAIARRLTESKTTVPHFYVTAHCRVDALLTLRTEINRTAPRKISVNDFVLKAVAGALQRVPAANAIWTGDAIRRFTNVDLAVAVAVEGGLLTPVVRSVDTLSLSAVSATVAELAERARAGRLQQKELEGGSFSVSNLGMYGVDEFSAILNPPQAGILAVGAAQQRPVVQDGALAVATVMTVTLSADHRVIDGAVAGEWMAAFRTLIESPLGMLI